ncbi:MAG: hypothetical protein ACOY4D_03495 [Pseudomonadota bacterium]
MSDLLQGDETRVWGDLVYTGQGEVCADRHKAKDFTHQKGHRHRALNEEQKAVNRIKSKVGAKAEHPFRFSSSSGFFGFAKTRYRD